MSNLKTDDDMQGKMGSPTTEQTVTASSLAAYNYNYNYTQDEAGKYGLCARVWTWLFVLGLGLSVPHRLYRKVKKTLKQLLAPDAKKV